MDGLNQFFQSNAAQMWLVLACLVLLLEVWVVLLTWRIVFRRQPAVVTPTTVQSPAPVPAPLEYDSVAHLQQQVYYSLQRVGMVRFNAYDDTGGDQSFAMVLADAYGNGVVMSSLFRRGESRVFAKPIAQWQSSYALSAEEQQAIERARSDETQPELTHAEA